MGGLEMKLHRIVRLSAVAVVLAGAAQCILKPQSAYGLVPTLYDLNGGGMTITGSNVAGTGTGGTSACGWTTARCLETLAGPVLAVSGVCAALAGPLSVPVCYALAAVDTHDFAVCCL